MDNLTISSIEDFKKTFDEVKKSSKKYIFRGQKEDEPLLPSIYRNKSFFVQNEQRMLEEFKQYALQIFTDRDKISMPTNDFEWLSLGQHYGLKTRYLDWTQSWGIALFFSTDGAVDKDGVIWIYELPPNESQKWLLLGSKVVKVNSPFQFKDVKIYHQKSFLDPRPDNQLGVLTLHPSPCKPMEKDEECRKNLTKLIVKSEGKSSINAALNDKGINSIYLLGGITGICRHINFKYGQP